MWGPGRHPVSFSHSGSQTYLCFGTTRESLNYPDACLGLSPRKREGGLAMGECELSPGFPGMPSG